LLGKLALGDTAVNLTRGHTDKNRLAHVDGPA
jgi:hypothetical protein